ncbi:unnamed protein product [Peronospora destructor]|uniref:Uncharacterized protein n=1 Tax=Peronospora destructor TaxID=86335 RepID=A0AAV0V3K6_9STRA|nr:unnamed protein product [Peronospora destructor]
MASYPSILLALSLVLSALAINVTQATYEAFAASSSSECCSKCIGKTSPVPYNYDPLIFDQCKVIKPAGVCCFECGNLGEPTYGDTVSYGADGVTAVVKAGTFISFTWNGVANVTYVSLKTGQKKTVTPTVSDAAAMKKSDTFLICAKSLGTIYFRGWGTDTCTEASPEHSVTIEKGDSSSTTCDASFVGATAPSSLDDTSSGSSSVAADATVKNCNFSNELLAHSSRLLSIWTDVATPKVTPDSNYHVTECPASKYDQQGDRTSETSKKPANYVLNL